MNVTINNAAIFGLSIILQVCAFLLMPLTKGFTVMLPTAGLIILFSTALGLLARLSYEGAELGPLLALGSAVVPLSITILSIFLFGESASAMKIALLSTACLLIGLATTR
jgi:multidrug transporter EmrE-like cation transporter